MLLTGHFGIGKTNSIVEGKGSCQVCSPLYASTTATKVIKYANTMKYEELQIETSYQEKNTDNSRQVGGPEVLCRRAHPSLVANLRRSLRGYYPKSVKRREMRSNDMAYKPDVDRGWWVVWQRSSVRPGGCNSSSRDRIPGT